LGEWLSNSLNYSGGTPTFGPLKTKASRRIVLITKSNASLLKEHLDEHGYGPQGTIFTTFTGALLRDDNFRPRVWKPAVRKAKSVPDQTRFHDLRHTHVALCIEAGMDLKQIQARLGHSSVKVTGDRHAHLYEGVTRRAVDALERLPVGE
jgi:integrase